MGTGDGVEKGKGGVKCRRDGRRDKRVRRDSDSEVQVAPEHRDLRVNPPPGVRVAARWACGRRFVAGGACVCRHDLGS
jgi:hypothetical protein